MAQSSSEQNALLKEILESVKSLHKDQSRLRSDVDAIVGRVNILSGIKQVHDVASKDGAVNGSSQAAASFQEPLEDVHQVVPESPSLPTTSYGSVEESVAASKLSKKSSVTSRIILTWVAIL